jgi:aquaporin Z
MRRGVVRDAACEFVGTYLHILAGIFAVTLGFAPASPLRHAIDDPMTRRLIVGLLFVGSAIAVAVSPLGRRSGGHLNPAISVGFWLHRRLSGRSTASYVAAQSAGAVAAATTAAVLAHSSVAAVGYAVTRPGRGIAAPVAAVLETGETALVLLVIFTLMSSARTARLTPLAIWPLISTYVWLLAPLTGASVNPARSLGPALVGHHLRDYWVYLVGPLTGAVVAATVWQSIGMRRTMSHKLCPTRADLERAAPIRLRRGV